MKILEINKFNYVKGGADRHFLELARLLRSKGQEVAVFSMENAKNDFSPWKKYFVSYVGYGKDDSLWQKMKGVLRMFYSFEARRKIKKLLDDFQPEVVHIHNIYHQISPSILPVIKKRGIPIVMTVHDYKLICPNYLLTCKGKIIENPKALKFWDFVKSKCFKNSYLKSFLVALESKFHKMLDIYDKNIDLYISPSVFTKKKLVQGGIREEKIIVLPHFFPVGKNVTLKHFARSENEQAKYVFCYGRLSKEKGVDKLMEIFKNFPEINLYLAGEIEGDLVVPEAENIKYLGFLNPNELDHYIKNSLFVVSPSKLPETFGLVALEAIKNGKPFVGYDCGAYGEIVESDKTGYLCKDERDFEEKIKMLAKETGLRVLFSRNALERAADFNGNKYYDKIAAIFDSLVKKA